MTETHLKSDELDGPVERLVLHCDIEGDQAYLTVELYEDVVHVRTTDGQDVELPLEAQILLTNKLISHRAALEARRSERNNG